MAASALGRGAIDVSDVQQLSVDAAVETCRCQADELGYAQIVPVRAPDLNHHRLGTDKRREDAQWRSGAGATSSVSVGAIRSQMWAKMRFQLSQ
jgi:hypothetical protein